MTVCSSSTAGGPSLALVSYPSSFICSQPTPLSPERCQLWLPCSTHPFGPSAAPLKALFVTYPRSSYLSTFEALGLPLFPYDTLPPALYNVFPPLFFAMLLDQIAAPKLFAIFSIP
ncbi:hypothetical protein GOP47_0002295 [Adiantum capillus-veneris]|uniref:Uncharacterized protein n=1 Tax=Adiantum capillus-veneris TaxID=13818 RepID=A0A9D4ZR42_ADICA|nr:hypothetical protein GOP47_0002295 [Adiantum capillus-veneris]